MNCAIRIMMIFRQIVAGGLPPPPLPETRVVQADSGEPRVTNVDTQEERIT